MTAITVLPMDRLIWPQIDRVAELLSEARKFDLHLTRANQTLTQMGG
jgi:hypothetical protein